MDRFDFHATFGDDYLYFYSPMLTDERNEAETEGVGDDLMLDRTTFDPMSGRQITRRTIVRDGQLRHSQHFVRLPTLPELQSWLTGAGFGNISFSGRRGAPLTLDSRRLVALATAT